MDRKSLAADIGAVVLLLAPLVTATIFAVKKGGVDYNAMSRAAKVAYLQQQEKALPKLLAFPYPRVGMMLYVSRCVWIQERWAQFGEPYTLPFAVRK